MKARWPRFSRCSSASATSRSQFNNGTLSAADKAAITAEVAQLCAEISDIGQQTSFNGINLLTGGATITFQVGANDGQTIAVTGVQLFGSGTSYEVDSALFTFSGHGRAWRRSTPRSTTCRRRGASSARCRTASSTR